MNTLRTSLLLTLLFATSAFAQDDARVVADTLPAWLQPGQSLGASVTLQNTGTSTWTRAAGFKLGADGDSDPFFPRTRVWLDPSDRVPPGAVHTFTFTLTAPAHGGTFLTDWRMVHEGVRWFGATARRQVQVGSSGPQVADDAQVVGQSLPTQLAPGAVATATVTMRNTGTSTWTRASFKLGANGDSDPFYSGTRVMLPLNASVPPGGSHTFSFTLTAPAQTGSHLTDWRMVHEGVRWFGATASQQVQVGQGPPPPPPGGDDRAALVSHTLPGTLPASTSVVARVVMRNDGTSTWTAAGGYKLGAVGDSDPLSSAGRINLPAGAAVGPGQSHTFQLTLTAGPNNGTHLTDWRMVREHVRWFGATASRQVTVTGGRTVVDASSLSKKLIMGYQGWFATPNDGAGRGWVHWGRNARFDPSHVTIDFWPDVSELDPDELVVAPGFTLPSGQPAHVFTSHKQKTVVRHFKWMKDHGIDGVALQRFSAHLGNSKVFAFRNEVTKHVKAGAELHGRVFFMMYDVSGHDPNTVLADLKRDWRYVVDTLGVLRSDRYLKHKGKPLLAVWGFGFKDRPGTPAQARAVIDWFQRDAPAGYRVTLLGGVPGGWRNLQPPSKTDPAWAAIYRSYDIISPWSVGGYRSDPEIDSYLNNRLRPDLAEATRVGKEYMPVVWPGFSWHNLKGAQLNYIPRRGGSFYWRQIYNAVDAGCTMLFNAMFDEVDEGTAMFKVAPTRNELPVQGSFVPLDIDGERLPSDWYLRLAGQATKMLRGEIPKTPQRPISPP